MIDPPRTENKAIQKENLAAMPQEIEPEFERAWAEETLRRAALRVPIADAAPDVLMRFGRDLRFLYVSVSLQEAFGAAPEAFVGKSIRQTLPAPLAAQWDAILRQTLQQGQYQELEFSYASPTGERFFQTRFVPELSKGEVTTILAITRDITERKAQAEALAAALQEAQAAAQAKAEFIAVISHELRTPLNGVIGMTGLLLETALSPEQRELGEMARVSAEVLLRLINDILDFSKIEAGKLSIHPAPFDLCQIAENVAELLAPKAREKRLELSARCAPDLPESLIGDAGRIQQIISNLAENAIKFTNQGSVRIEVSAERRSATEVRVIVNVTDTGIGIAPENIERIFEPFTQANMSGSRSQNGTGLGLGISRQLAERMGGTLDVTSVLGTGSTFRLALNLPQDDAQKPARPVVMPETLADVGLSGLHPRVLVAEDNIISQKVAVLILEKIGCRVDVVSSGTEVLRMMEMLSYDLILMDCQMPDMDGYEAAQEIRRREGTGRHTPIVAMTANLMPGASDRCTEAGMDAYIPKPIRQEELLRTVRALFQPPERTPPAAPSQPSVERLSNTDAPDASVLDRAALLNRVGNSVSLLGSLTKLYRAEWPKLLSDMQQAMEAGDAENFRRAAHKLRGVLMSLEAGAGVKAMRQLELSAQADWPASAAVPLAQVVTELTRIQNALLEMASFDSP